MARGEWWEYLIPGHNVGLMVGDVYDGITGNSEKNAGTGVFGTRKNGSNSYQYAQSNDRVTTAKNNLDYIKGQKPGEYQSEYGSQISGTQSQLDKMNQDGFSYDYTKDAAYQQYKNQYTRGAELASENAAANASARSGGQRNNRGASSPHRLRQQLGHFQRADGLPEHHERAFGRGRQLIQPGLQRICRQKE